MTVIMKILQWLSLAVAFCSSVFYSLEVTYRVLLVFIALDILSGTIQAITEKKLSSDLAYMGILKKGGELIVVAMAYYLQQTIPAFTQVPLSEALAGFYIYVEGLSILTHAAALGVPIPRFLRDALAVFAETKDQSAGPRASLPQ